MRTMRPQLAQPSRAHADRHQDEAGADREFGVVGVLNADRHHDEERVLRSMDLRPEDLEVAPPAEGPP